MRQAGAAVLIGVLLLLTACSSGDDAADPAASGSAVAVAPCGGEAPPRPTGGAYECAFDDEFDGDTIDRQKWKAQGTWYSGVTTGRNDCFVDSPENLSQSGGALHVTARQVATPFTCPSPYGDFTSHGTIAALATRDHFTQTYGRFEFRARFPHSTDPGLHSALWAYPARHTYGPWPASGEIDVAEWWSARPAYVVPSVHYAGEPSPLSSGACTVADPWEWHRYAVEWTTTEMRFLYDGAECFRHAWAPDPPLVPPQPFDQPFYLVITQAFGTEWNAVTAATPAVATLDVDWVRVWK